MYGQFFILFGLILVGYYCNKKGYLPMETNKNVGNMVMRAGSHDDSVWLFDAAIRAEKRLGQPPSAHA